jgi:hypothetical protein
MYFDRDAANVYKEYDGAAWNTISAPTFTFDFATYRTIWNVDQPDIVSVMLGINDFITKANPAAVQAAFPAWKAQMDSLIASVLADNPSAKIAILLPTSVNGPPDSADGVFVEWYNANMWEARKLIINEYDAREASGIYVVDTGSSLDPDYGFVASTEAPFSEYTGAATREVSVNIPHPSTDGYNQIGTRFAAFIQRVRP